MTNKGFIAFAMLVIISSFILVFQYINSIEIGHFFDMVQRKQYREIAYYNAYSCIDQALLALNQDYFLSIGSVMKFDDFNCSIISIVNDINSPNKRIIRVFGNYKNIVVYRSAIARLYDDHLEIISIE